MKKHVFALLFSFAAVLLFQGNSNADGGCANIVTRVEGVSGEGGATGIRSLFYARENAANNACANAKDAAVAQATAKSTAGACGANCVAGALRSSECNFSNGIGGQYPIINGPSGNDPTGGDEWHQACMMSELTQGRSGPAAEANCTQRYSAQYPEYDLAQTKANGTAVIPCLPMPRSKTLYEVYSESMESNAASSSTNH